IAKGVDYAITLVVGRSAVPDSGGPAGTPGFSPSYGELRTIERHSPRREWASHREGTTFSSPNRPQPGVHDDDQRCGLLFGSQFASRTIRIDSALLRICQVHRNRN